MDIIESILKFRIDNKIFAIDANKVSQILRVPNITPVPLTDSSFKGVCVVGGKIASVVDLGVFFNLNKIEEKKDTSRIVTFANEDGLYAFLVEEVLGITFIDENNYEPSNDGNSKIIGLYKENGDIYQIIDTEEVLKSINILEFNANTLEKLSEENQIDATNSNNYVKYLFFTIQNELFAIDIDTVKELVFVPDIIVPIPESEDFVLGMITLRNKIVNTIDFSILLDFDKSHISNKSRLIIIQYKTKSIAVLVDEVEEVKDIEISSIENVPENFKDNKIEAVYKDKNGTIASIINRNFLKELIEDYYLEEEKENNNPQNNTSSKESLMIEMVVFNIDKEEFAIDIDNVQEIIKYTDITPMPEAPEFVEGVINLRGVVIPIVSLQERLHFNKNITEKTKILICNIKNNKIGFLVDDVNEILSVDENTISTTKSSDALFDEIITLDEGERVILKLRADRLLDESDFEQLEMINKEEK